MYRHKLRKTISTLAGITEILVAVIILLAVLISAVLLAVDLFGYSGALFGKEAVVSYNDIFSTAIYIVIGIEMIKMIVKHTPDSVLEVVLFVVAKRIVADAAFGSLDLLLCVLAIAAIFAVRKFLHFDASKMRDGTTFGADTRICDIEDLLHIDLPDIGTTVGEVAEGELHRLERPVTEGEELTIGEAIFRIHSMDGGAIRKVEVVPLKKR